jgi:hypothetical protein
MDLPSWITLIGALIGGGGFLGTLVLLPKLRAEARKLNVETDGLVADRWLTEIHRIDGELDQVRRENKWLRGENRRLSRRVSGLEDILRLHPPTPEMQTLIDDLNRKTSNGDGK